MSGLILPSLRESSDIFVAVQKISLKNAFTQLKTN